MKISEKGFSLVELLVVVAIIGVLSTVVFASTGGIRAKARDARRKSDLAQVGRFLSMGQCFMPAGGAGDYDVSVLLDEFKVKYPQYATFIAKAPKDPKAGDDVQSGYRYLVSEDGKKCALYANLENANEPTTLNITAPTAGGGKGVLRADQPGVNGTHIYLQQGN